MVGFIVACSRQRDTAKATIQSAESALLELDTTPDKPIGFGYKNAWLAIKTDDPAKIAETLKLHDLQPANWRTGLNTSYERYDTHVFITPPVGDWVFVVGIALPDIGDSQRPDRCTPVLKELGTIYDSVFFFGTHRVVGFHVWARVDHGRVTRAYTYLGEQGVTLWDKGEKTQEEGDLRFNFFADEPPKGEGEEYWERDELSFPDEEDVIKIAEAWTMNPLSLDKMELLDSVGLVGQVPRDWRQGPFLPVRCLLVLAGL